MTASIAQSFTEDHRRCDRLLADCEAALSARDWPRAETTAAAFREALLRHFAFEEERLFPELERVAPPAAGPTGVMRMEHQQMRQLLDSLLEAIQAQDRETGLGDLETLHLFSQQHNAKEEGILYPMADRSLGDQASDLIDRFRAS